MLTVFIFSCTLESKKVNIQYNQLKSRENTQTNKMWKNLNIIYIRKKKFSFVKNKTIL